MYPLDFEEFLYENGSNEFAIDNLKQKFFKLQSSDENTYFKILDLFKKYLLTDLIPTFITNYIITIVGKKNIYLENMYLNKVRKMHNIIYNLVVKMQFIW